MTELTPEEIANEQSKPGVFSLIERLQNRNMPTEEVVIYLDEQAAYERERLTAKHAETTDKKRLAEIDAKLDELEARIRDSAVTLKLVGISSKRYDELLDRAKETYPIEVEETVAPFTGEKTKRELPNEDRDELFNTLYLAEVVREARMGDDVDDNITETWIAQFKNHAPLDAVRSIYATGMKLRMATEWMDGIQNEDFSPRP